NGFQPSFKLISKTRDGARVRKQYDSPKTPWERLLAAKVLSEAQSQHLQAVYQSLDPIALLQGIREAQQRIADLVDREPSRSEDAMAPDTQAFLRALKSSWKQAEVRPTRAARPRPPRHWRTRKDPLALVWPRIELWLEQEPELSATVVLAKLAKDEANSGVSASHLRTLQRRIKQWRADQVDRLLHLPRPISTEDHEEAKSLEEVPSLG
ncbi:transposase, partial [Acidithiobacillus caldus]